MRTDELNLQFVLPEPAASAMESWRAAPPDALRDFDRVDDSYNSLTYERTYLDTPAKLVAVVSLGIMRKMMASIYRVTVRFDADGDHRAKVTAIGTLDEETRTALGRWAAERGQVVQDWGVPG